MKRNKIIVLVVLCIAMTALADQAFRVTVGNVITAFTTSELSKMPVTDGATLTVGDATYNIADIDKINVEDNSVADNTVSVTYNGDEATVVIAGNIAGKVTATVDGAHVKLIQGTDVTEEITYTLEGESEDGEFYMEGSYKATVELNGLTLTNKSGAPIDIENGKRIDLSVKKGTVNTLTDDASSTTKGCLYCKGHLELKGKGELNVYAYGSKAHGIFAKEYIEMKNCTVNVLAATKDGVNCNQYLLIESGELNIKNVGDDGIQTSFKDDTDREEEDTGCITISGGTLNVDVTATAAKGIKADADVVISGGTITVTTGGDGEWDETDAKTKASTCISADGITQIDGGTLSLTSTGAGGKGISCDGDFIMNDGDLTVSTSGGMVVYANSRLYNGTYTGNTDRLDSDAKSSPKGIKADGNVTINGGNISVTTKGAGGEGIESKSVLTINGGNIECDTYDDAINSSGTRTSTNYAGDMYINGGTIFVTASNNDGLDSNGNMYLNGGTIVSLGATSPECGIDANDEEGYHIYITGSTLIGVGGGTSNPYSNSKLTIQPAIIFRGSLSQNQTLIVNDNSGNNILAYTLSRAYSNTSGGGWRPGGGGGSTLTFLISSPDLKKGSAYTVYTGASVSGEDYHGLIKNATVNSTGTSAGSVSSLSSPYSSIGSGGGRF